ncbi:unnamed protein product [Onchocerca flexuosa]|uniref:Uncharacterized protein n=1 Tax=Onchocerca flexuosa TaxID=387005 RepID=A0A183H6S2_9BILA|nr:unnamed protein product [Onchocerca flexuosa]
MLQKDGGRNYPSPEYDSSTLRSRRKSSTRILETRRGSRSLYSSSNEQQNFSSVYKNFGNTQVLNPKSIVEPCNHKQTYL